MTGTGASVPPRAWGGFLLAVVLVVGLGAPASGAAVAPTDETSPATPEPTATCELSARREAQVVACVARGMQPDAPVALTVVRDGQAPEDAAIGGSTTGEDGTARVDAHVPCGTAGPATVEVTGASADGGRFRHVEPVTLDGSCRSAWELTSDEWATVLATLLVLAVGAAATVAWRRRARRRRRRGVSSGHRGRPRPPTPRARGRRRSPRRRRRRR